MIETGGIDLLVQDLDKLVQWFPLETEKALKVAALDAKALIEKRVTSTGKGVQGDFSPYGNEWRKKRIAKLRQVDHKDFHYSGSMWGGVRVLDSAPSTVTIGTSGHDENGASNRDKMEGHVERENQALLDMTTEEIETVTAAVEKELAKLFVI